MAFKHKDMNFSVFPNEHKEDGDNRPTHKGRGVIHGKDVSVSLWSKVSSDGTPFFSGKVEPPYVPKEKKSDSGFPWDDD